MFFSTIYGVTETVEKGPGPSSATSSHTCQNTHGNWSSSSQAAFFVPSKNYSLLTSSATTFELGFPQSARIQRKHTQSFQTETNISSSTSIWFLLQCDLCHRLSGSDPVKLTRLEENSDTGSIWKFPAVWTSCLPQKHKGEFFCCTQPKVTDIRALPFQLFWTICLKAKWDEVHFRQS